MQSLKKNVKFTLLVTLVFTAGCQSYPIKIDSQQMDNRLSAPQITSPSADALAIPADQNAFILPYSPWGEQVQVANIDRYTAASGRSCARLELATHQVQTALVCQNSAGEWHPARQF
jgi:hypothetical protein